MKAFPEELDVFRFYLNIKRERGERTKERERNDAKQRNADNTEQHVHDVFDVCGPFGKLKIENYMGHYYLGAH